MTLFQKLDDDDDGVYGVRLRLWTVANYGPIVHMSMQNHGGMMMSTEENSSTCPPDLWQSYQQSNLVASRRNGQKEWEFGLLKYFCSHLQVIFSML
jgi:hypothetical protein